jgi:hypothetical protein
VIYLHGGLPFRIYACFSLTPRTYACFFQLIDASDHFNSHYNFLCRYEFGTISANGIRSPMAVSTMPMYTFGSKGGIGGLPVGNTSLYGCAIDMSAATHCPATVVTVKEPKGTVNIADALSAVNVGNLANTKDVSALARGALTVASLASYGTRGGATLAPDASAALTTKASSLITTLKSTADVRDIESMRQAVGAAAGLTSLLSVVSDEVRANVHGIATNGVKAALHANKPLSSDGASQLITLLAFSHKPRTLASNQHRRLNQAQSEEVVALSTNLDSITKVMLLGATPGSGYMATGGDGMYVSVANQMGNSMESLIIKVRCLYK